MLRSIEAAMPKRLVKNPEHVKATLFGVTFVWPNPGEGYAESINEGMGRISAEVLESNRDALHRRPDVVGYWHALRHTLFAPLPKRNPRELDVFGLAAEVAMALRDQELPDELVCEVTGFELLEKLRSRVVRYDGGRFRRSSAVNRGNAEHIVFGADGRWHGPEPGLLRVLELPMPSLGGRADRIDWDRTMRLAVLASLKADFEVYAETGFLPVHVCERRACRAFFRVRRMAARQRFCSDTCRACAPREQ